MIWRDPPPLQPAKPKQGKKITPEDLARSGSEDGHQAALFCWAADSVGKYPQLKWMHSIPNGGQRNIIEASKLVATGTRGGVWDVFLPYPLHPYGGKGPSGLYIEMKKPSKRGTKNGGLSEDQIEFGQYAKNAGYCCAVCYNWEEARDVLIGYLEGKL